MVKRKKAGKKTVKQATYRSWNTTDADEVAVRKERASNEPLAVEVVGELSPPYADYRVSNPKTEASVDYLVEIRHLDAPANTCTCPDFEKNGLGTCKHIEYVIATRRGNRKHAVTSPHVELYMSHCDHYRAAVLLPESVPDNVERFLADFLNVLQELKAPWEKTLPVLLHELGQAPQDVQSSIRVSREVSDVAGKLRRRQRLARARKEMERRLADPQTAPQFAKHRLYDYQLQGMLHLAFTGRALLADEMGLGKTVQAIAACKLLEDLGEARRVLVVCPASLKTEWEEQIRKFTDLSSALVYGRQSDRHEMYASTQAFFVVTNYEQILRDEVTINKHLQPDVVILDEAQRIKNWQTKTAQAIKRLEASYAFVLTGTPLENRIDEIYSIVEFIDPHIFGSLFRFNRDFYEFDDRGRASGLKNMRELNKRLAPIMMRRRKDQIQDQLPERIDNNFFVKLTPGQEARYADYEQPALQLMSIAQRRPLIKAEMDKLQRLLACMRMICDSIYILDQETKQSPKVDELLSILEDVWDSDPTRKVIVFSEWERMLYLLAQALENKQLDYAWHTGSVDQAKRRGEINRFKESPDCKLFLSTDSGATGLNLQAASVVVNLDLPWNPAKLEQRIARAWRKHQQRTVQVINLVAEKTIEHRMLSTLTAKRELADGVLDARGELDELQLPTSRAAFLHRLEQLTQAEFAKPTVGPVAEPQAPMETPSERLAESLPVKMGDHLRLCQARVSSEGAVDAAVVVVRQKHDKVRAQVEACCETAQGSIPSQLHVLDEAEYALLQQLAEAGMIAILDGEWTTLFETATASPQDDASDNARRLELAEPTLAQARRQRDMGQLLAGGGFEQEALAPLCTAVDLAGRALAVLVAQEAPSAVPESFDASLHDVLAKQQVLDSELAVSLLRVIQDPAEQPAGFVREILTDLLDVVESQVTYLKLR